MINDNHLIDLNSSLVQSIDRWTVGQQDCTTAIPNLVFFRRESPTQPSACKVEPSIVIVVQGAKQLLTGEHSFSYDSSHFLVNSLDIPGNSQAVEATTENPCLGLVLKLNLGVIAELLAHGSPQHSNSHDVVPDVASALGTITSTLLEPFSRLVSLLDEPDSIEVLSPLIEKEIHFRLLCTEQASRLRHIASAGSTGFRITKAIHWLRENYRLPLRIEDLAAYSQMSASNLHFHFRQLTAMSPLQYQKWLRLHEARHLMLNHRLPVASAAFQVGYESASQFSREYGRLFGVPPKRDIEELRRNTVSMDHY
ncbi:AraC family transcriptional regulator [Pokkaliibacter plantistimulans]|uniref:AraC family transcriptional regulator n=1 Tax=Proteobacteria bacterium 228 TaxID=2083153 RepID=A0A2S5KS79_9PROT|nr:AraC family transcriptional regulator [Pokkaliibacter plantistimulans]PPC77573.1 AraC family transcriptional regulator [Pokkaliibacter plantistimulans]